MSNLAPFASAIGPIVTGAEVEQAALDVLRRWSSTYLAHLEVQHGLEPGALPRLRAWTTAPEFEKWPEDQLPAVLLVSPGISEEPLPDGAGYYRVRFSLGVAVIVSAASLADTARLAKWYGAVMRTILLQHQSLEGFAGGITWVDENYDDVPSEDTRTLGASQSIFAVEVRGFARRWNGPATPFRLPGDDPDGPPSEPPPLGPMPDDPIIETVEVLTTNQTEGN
jgi:hypothetical protein